jgi:hypothetical protein
LAKQSAKEVADLKRQLETVRAGLSRMERALEGATSETLAAEAQTVAVAEARLAIVAAATAELTSQHFLQAFRQLVNDHAQPQQKADGLLGLAEAYAGESGAVVAELTDAASKASREVAALLVK